MTITTVKAMIAKSLTVGLVAAAFVVATPSKANAQVAFGIHVGGPVPAYGRVHPVYGGYYHPGFYGPAYGYDRRLEFARHEDFERREAFIRHEERERFDRDHRFYGR